MRFYYSLLSALLVITTSYSATANTMMLRHSALCTQAFAQAEQHYGIPKHLLMAVAKTESGRYSKAAGETVPWPWTTNIAGKGGYHDSIHDAMTAVKRAQQRGVESIDVGCMQINLKHHPDAFYNIKDAFNPVSNVRYAASFLRSNYDEFKSWPKAIAAYHSRTSSKGSKYYAMVQKRWRDVRVRNGGGAIDYASYTPSNQPRIVTPRSNNVYANQGRAHSTFKIAMRDSQDSSGYKPVSRNINTVRKSAPASMKVITVASRPVTSGSDVLVVTPLSQRSNFDVSFNESPSQASSKEPKGNYVRLASGDEGGTSGQPSKAPNFIFR